MNTSAATQSFVDLEGMLRSAVEQIVSPPPPAEVAQRLLERAAKWEAPSVRTPAKTGTRPYFAVGAALALGLLLAVAITMVGRLPREKSVAVLPKEEKTEPNVNPPEALRAIPQPLESAASLGVAPRPSDASAEKRLGAQAFGGLRTGGGLVAGANPSRWFSVAGEATILVSTGGKEPIRLGEKQAFTSEAILHVWDWSKSDKSRPLDASCPSFSVSPDGQWIVTNEGQKIEIATGKVTKLPDLEPQPPRNVARKVWTRALFSRDGRRLALLLAGENQTATFSILELENGKKLCDIENQWPAMLPAAFAPNGSEIFLMGKDNFVRRFDAATGKERQKYEPAHQNSVRAMIVSPSGKLLVSGGSRGDILLWDVASRQAAAQAGRRARRLCRRRGLFPGLLS